ncbi:MAG: ROK family glucokinase [Nocardioidaceae bacterium]
MSLTIGIDVGGTKIAAGVVDQAGAVVEEQRRNTPATDAEATEAAIIDVVRELQTHHEVEAVGIGAAGYIDADRSTVLFAPNLAWREEPLRAAIEIGTGVPVVVENDVNAAAWGEFQFGAGADVDDLVMVALGTGIGGGIVLKGELFRGSFGMAGEFGHVRVVPDGQVCGCGNRGCWEQYASGHALQRFVREVAETGSPLAAALLEAAEGSVAAISGPMITAAAQRGDRLALDAFESVGMWLGIGIADLACSLDPGVVVVGGGLSEAGELLLKPAKTAFKHQLTGRGHRPELQIRVAELGNKAGMTGSADLARHR